MGTILRTVMVGALVALGGVSALVPEAIAAEAPRARSAKAPDEAERARIQRLAALARAWGQVRYAHPALVTRDIDWDRALFDAIPRVSAARNDAEFRDALARMLDVLEDPATRVLSPPAAAAAERSGPLIAQKDGIVRADLARIGAKAQAGGSSAAVQAEVATLVAALPGAKLLVLDARGTRPPEDDYATSEVLHELIRQASPGALRLGALRYRSYSGYPSQTGEMGSGGYAAGMMSQLPVELAGKGTAPLPPMLIVANARSAVPAELIAGLQASGQAWLLADGGADALGATPTVLKLAEGIELRLRTTEVVAPDGQVGIRADVEPGAEGVEGAIASTVARLAAGARLARAAAATAAPGTAALRPDADRPYETTGLPPLEHRLLALFRFWSVMERFFPYRPLIGPGWDDLLERYIPQFEGNRDLADYQLTLRRLLAESHDSHVSVRTPMLASAERLGRHQPPVLLRFVEGRTVVAQVLGEGTGLRVGDAIERIDGRPIEQARADTGQYVSASASQTWQRDLHRNLLRGQADSVVELDVRGLDGTVRRISVKRTVSPDDDRLGVAEFKPRAYPVFGVRPGGFGYVDLARLTPAQVDEMFAAIAGTKATIFDMRGYPHGTAWSIAPRLGTRAQPVGASFRRPLFEGPGSGDLTGLMLEFQQRIPEATGTPYLGKVVMLINENTQSQAEHTGLFFEAATDVTFIGTPTAGANGDVTYMMLPGGYAVSFSGHDVRHADGRQLQRMGLQPHVTVAPTIAGMARGEDEVLAAAEAWLQHQMNAR